MDSPSLNQYEQQLYSVFKSFDVDDEEALPRAAVLQLCHALQLEDRGAALVESLFERRAATTRVSFAQFRSGLLAALGAAEPPPAPPDAPHSDDDSSGREVAPKFVYGSKKYGRRSRPPSTAEPVAAASDEPERARRRLRCKRSASAMDSDEHPTPEPAPPDLDHDTRIDCERALALCRHLHMDNIDRRLVERIFRDASAAETTVGQFFDRLNASLTSSISVSCEAGAAGAECDAGVADDAGRGTLPLEAVVEAWELAGVHEPRRLLAELGFCGVAVCAPDLERVLDHELGALPDPPDARGLLLSAALALSRLRQRRAQNNAAATTAERDRLRADVAEANRRARILAQEVDENHARLEAELAASLRRAEARHAEVARAGDAERAAERERAATERALLEADVARRAEAEARLRAEVTALRERVEEAESRAAAADERTRAAEAECTRLVAQLRSAAAAEGTDGGCGGGEGASEAGAREEELRRDNARLRDRCDELCAALEAAARPTPASPSAPSTRAASWREEAGAAGCATTPQDRSEDSSLVSVEGKAPVAAGGGAGGDAPRPPHDVDALHDLVRELEASLEQMRLEYERCEEYWSGKLEEERRAQDAELAASDARLAALAARVAEYERQYVRLPAIEERASLEAQYAHLEEDAARLRDQLAAATLELQDRDTQLAALKEQLAAPAPPAPEPAPRRRRAHPAPAPAPLCAGGGVLCAVCGGRGCGCAGVLAARAARAEGAVARLAARLAHADMLVKDLYVENCRLPLPPRPPRPITLQLPQDNR